eukprot:4669386-Prymnesium_polylepis.1
MERPCRSRPPMGGSNPASAPAAFGGRAAPPTRARRRRGGDGAAAGRAAPATQRARAMEEGGAWEVRRLGEAGRVEA